MMIDAVRAALADRPDALAIAMGLFARSSFRVMVMRVGDGEEKIVPEPRMEHRYIPPDWRRLCGETFPSLGIATFTEALQPDGRAFWVPPPWTGMTFTIATVEPTPEWRQALAEHFSDRYPIGSEDALYAGTVLADPDRNWKTLRDRGIAQGGAND